MSRLKIDRQTALIGDIVLGVVWFALAILSGVDGWGWGWTVFFGIAAGERYGTARYR